MAEFGSKSNAISTFAYYVRKYLIAMLIVYCSSHLHNLIQGYLALQIVFTDHILSLLYPKLWFCEL